MLSRPEHIQSFPTLTSIRPPRAAAVLAWIIGIGICLAVLVLLYVPWVQTSAGTGRVIAPNPADRVQTADSDGSRPPIPTRSRPAFRFDVGHH
ncbi:MAG: hypothetical protein K2Y56_17915, partial [Methylobacterium sp.]|nr:hypothetical protein [Methylobacterium sp.]